MLHYLAQRLLWLFVRSFMLTYRFKMTGTEHRETAIKAHPKGSFMIPIWHGQAFGILTAHAWAYPFLVMASRSKDGDFAAYVSTKLGFTPIRGSSRKGDVDKGGKAAMQEYIQKLKEGNRGGITVDGPKGPYHKCKPGIVLIAQGAGCMILPIVSSASKSYQFEKSWDKFILPLPFSKIVVRHGEPVFVPETTTPEEVNAICELVNQRMEEAQKEADSELKLWLKGHDSYDCSKCGH